MPSRAAGAVTTAFPALPWRRRIRNTITQRIQQRTSSPIAIYVSKSDNIRERLPQLVKPRVAKHENNRGHCAQLPQRAQTRRATLEERVTIPPNQDEHGILRENLQRRGGQRTFGITDGRQKKPQRQQKPVDVRQVTHEDSQRGQKPAKTCRQQNLGG